MNNEDSAIESHCRRTAALAMEIARRAGVDRAAVQKAAMMRHALDGSGAFDRAGGGLGRLAWEVVCGEQAREISGIVQVSNLLDEQMEALEFEYKEMDEILDEIQSFAWFEGFDPALIGHVRAMRCPDFGQYLRLPVGSGAARRLFLALRQGQDSDLGALEKIALADPVLTGSLLAVANSALYGRAYRVGTVRRAIASIGLVAARKVMLAAAMMPVFGSAGLSRLWSHSVSSAPLCAALSQATGLLTEEEGLVLGLVHDIGAVALQFLPRETRQTQHRLVEDGCPEAYVERLILGQDHGEIGAGLLAEWNFPAEVVEAVRFHHQPERSGSSVAAMAYVAEFWSGLDEDLPSFGRVEACLERTGMTHESLMGLGIGDSAMRAMRSVA
jgi:HD-like signal output (HDOD) protein